MRHRTREAEELLRALACEQRFSGLAVTVEAGRLFVRGELPILSVEGAELDRYSLEIEVPTDPVLLPVVRETGGRIPWTADRHMFTNGIACVMLPDERWKYFPIGTPLVDFLNGPLLHYLIGQSMVEEGLEWPAERRHNQDGVLDYYQELFETDDPATIVRSLYLLTREQVKGHWECACGSGKKLRTCCRDRFATLRARVHPKIAHASWERFGLLDVRPYSGDRLRDRKDLEAQVMSVLSTRSTSPKAC